MSRLTARRRLTDDERAIRRSRGIPIARLLPFLLPIVALLIMSGDQQLFEQCIGSKIQGSSRSAGWLRLIAAIPCSPIYIRDFADHWWVIGMFVLGVASTIPQVFWLREHKAYWDAVRAKEKLKRAEKAAVRNASQKADASDVA